jgi:hypothetical protein
MAAIYSNGGNRWNILGFNFTKRDALSSLYKISMMAMYSLNSRCLHIPVLWIKEYFIVNDPRCIQNVYLVH